MTHTIENKTLNEGTKIRVICVSRGGNPLPEIEWLLDGKKLQPVSTQSVVYTVESILDIVLQREHHQKALECRSVNKVGNVKKQVTLQVSCKISVFFKYIFFIRKLKFFKICHQMLLSLS